MPTSYFCVVITDTTGRPPTVSGFSFLTAESVFDAYVTGLRKVLGEWTASDTDLQDLQQRVEAGDSDITHFTSEEKFGVDVYFDLCSETAVFIGTDSDKVTLGVGRYFVGGAKTVASE